MRDKGVGEEGRSGRGKRRQMREKGWEEGGPKAHSKNSDLGTPMI